MSTAKRLAAAYGPWAVITGASDGIGRALATQLAAARLNVALVARRADVLDDLAADLAARHGIETRVLVADLSDAAAVPALLSAFDDLEVGLFVAAAGFGTSGDFIRTDLDTELDMIALNCGAVLASTRHFAKRMIPRKRGGIILFSSLGAFQGVARAANYAATKAWVQVFAEGIARELTAHRIDVLVTAPGPVETGFGGRADLAMNGVASPDQVARETLRALGRRGTVRPVFFNRFLQTMLSTLPRSLRARILQQVLKGMTKHQA